MELPPWGIEGAIFQKKTCSNECYFIVRQNAGKKGGSKTSSLEFHKRNRSSNEKMFFAKIKEIYPDAIANKRLFDGWDADVIIPSQKLAIHWNGVWHYKSVMGNELLERVQQKDKSRYEAIERHGYKNYIIQDMGPMNSNKVEKEYVDFQDIFKNIFTEIIHILGEPSIALLLSLLIAIILLELDKERQ